MKTTTRIIDSTNRNEIKGRIGRFIVTHYRRGEATEGAWGVFEGVRAPKITQDMGIGKGELIAAIKAATAHNADRSMSFVHVVSLYDKGMKTWWPCELADAE
jgi:hypothetical protein